MTDHPCQYCKPLNPPPPHDEAKRLAAMEAVHASDARRAAFRADAIQAAITYRAAEQDGTPRIWRGEDLHDLGVTLDTALEPFQEKK